MNKSKLYFITILFITTLVVSSSIYDLQHAKHYVVTDGCSLGETKQLKAFATDDSTEMNEKHDTILYSTEKITAEEYNAIRDSLKEHDKNYLYQAKLNRLIYCDYIEPEVYM